VEGWRIGDATHTIPYKSCDRVARREASEFLRRAEHSGDLSPPTDPLISSIPVCSGWGNPCDGCHRPTTACGCEDWPAPWL